MDHTAQLTAVKNYARQILGADKSGHALDHLARVADLATKINEQIGEPLHLVVACAYLHDCVDDKLVADPTSALADLQTFLQKNDFTEAEVALLTATLPQMSFSATLQAKKPDLPMVGLIVRDADWLDALGAMGIGRAFYYGGKFGEVLYDPTIPPRKLKSKAEYRNLANETVINHFYEKLFLLGDMLATASAKELAKPRLALMRAFVAAFKAEYSTPATAYSLEELLKRAD